jgi:hypothetical protein
MSKPSTESNEESTRPPEFEERFGNALAAVFGNFAVSSALAARVHRPGARAAALRYAAQRAVDRQRAMSASADNLRRRLDADSSKADRLERERLESARRALLKREKEPEGMISLEIPGLKRDIGLGDVVSKLTAAIGLNHCGGCAKRAAALNWALTFRAQKGVK